MAIPVGAKALDLKQVQEIIDDCTAQNKTVAKAVFERVKKCMLERGYVEILVKDLGVSGIEEVERQAEYGSRDT